MSVCNVDTNSTDNSEYESADDDESAENNFRSESGSVRYQKTQCYSGRQQITSKVTNSKDGGCNFENNTDQSVEAEITEINETQEHNRDIEHYSVDPPENDDLDEDTTEEPFESSPEVAEIEVSYGDTTEDTENVNDEGTGEEKSDHNNPSESGPNDESESFLSGSESQESVDVRCPEEFDVLKAGELLLKLEDDDIGLTKGKMVKFATLIVVIRAGMLNRQLKVLL